MTVMIQLNASNRWILTRSEEEFLTLAVLDWISCANKAIAEKNSFHIALSGGSTPIKIFEELVKNKHNISDTSKIFFFWGDERSVPIDSPESNYGNAIDILKNLGTPKSNFFAMQTLDSQGDIAYEELILKKNQGVFDFIMLGMGPDGHTASLFPETKALEIKQRLVSFNEVPSLKTTRMTLTYPCLNKSKHNVVYIDGENKKQKIKEIIAKSTGETTTSFLYPIERVGTELSPAFWFLSPNSYDLSDYEGIPPERKLVLS